jgi:membrane-bound lytic murein transglycosylase F
MRRPLALVLGLALASSSALAADLELRKPGVLQALVVDGSPAFFLLKSAGAGDPGLDREILEGFARLHGLRVDAVEAPSWAALVPWLVEGRGDLLAGGVTETPARAQKIAFSAEVMPTRLVLVSRKPTRLLATLDDLRQEKVATVKGSSMAEALQAAGIEFDGGVASGGVPEALRTGRASATLSGIEDALLYQRADASIQIGGFVGPSGTLAFGLRKDAPRLKQALDEYVTNLRHTPTWGRLVVKYFGDRAPELLKRARGE